MRSSSLSSGLLACIAAGKVKKVVFVICLRELLTALNAIVRDNARRRYWA
jgi:hypothetical protein